MIIIRINLVQYKLNFQFNMLPHIIYVLRLIYYNIFTSYKN